MAEQEKISAIAIFDDDSDKHLMAFGVVTPEIVITGVEPDGTLQVEQKGVAFHGDSRVSPDWQLTHLLRDKSQLSGA